MVVAPTEVQTSSNNGTTTQGSNVVTGLQNNRLRNATVGQYVFGPGILPNTTVAAIDLIAGTFTISAPAGAGAGAGALTFSSNRQSLTFGGTLSNLDI